jgi:putative PIG3 family NAD(P)H quinone oxidoreductase
MTANITGMMTAIAISEYGGPDVLKPVSVKIPQPAPGEVLIKVAAAGVNRPDVAQRQGRYPAPPGASEIPGLEVAGVVVATGRDTKSITVGDRVCALVTGGGYGEYCVAPAPQCLPVPKGLNMIQAAALPETFFTVWSNIFDRANLKPHETLLVHGGTSGIGTTAIQLAKAKGARVFATAGSDNKCRACLELGADVAINYQTRDFVRVIAENTDGQGVDVILDMVGGDYVQKNIDSLSPDGRLVQIAFMKTPKVEVNLLQVMLKRLIITGSTLRARDVAFKGAIAARLHEEVWPLISSGVIRPVIDATFPLVRAAEAHHRLEASSHIGKIILTLE